jgi:hypothetical protein
VGAGGAAEARVPLGSFPVDLCPLCAHSVAPPTCPGVQSGVSYDGVPDLGKFSLLPADSSAQFWADSNGCSERLPRELEVGGLTAGIGVWSETWDCPTDSEVILYRVVDGPHQWPTGSVLSASWEISPDSLTIIEPFKSLVLDARRSSGPRQGDRVALPFGVRITPKGTICPPQASRIG